MLKLRPLLEEALSLPGEDLEIVGTTPASVLVPFVFHDDGWKIIFTRRAEDLSKHRGEISFPGGRIDDGESSRDAALREAFEELGIVPEHVDVVGKMGRVFTAVSNFTIEPWVGVIPASELKPNPAEIAEVIAAPLDLLLASGTRRQQIFISGRNAWRNPAFDVGANVIWGATGRILGNLLDNLGPLVTAE